jgi:hypothetical protein
MNDSFLSLVIGVSMVASIAFVLATTWMIAETSISKDCERLGSFYIGHKTYKCELTKEGNRELK